MSYQAFLIAMSQTASNRKARFVINNQLVWMEALPKKDRWSLFTKIFHVDDCLPSSIQDCLTSSDFMRWQYQGAYLKYDAATDSIYLVNEVVMPAGKYIPFRRHLNEFLNAADEWKRALDSLAQKDCISIPK